MTIFASLCVCLNNMWSKVLGRSHIICRFPAWRGFDSYCVPRLKIVLAFRVLVIVEFLFFMQFKQLRCNILICCFGLLQCLFHRYNCFLFYWSDSTRKVSLPYSSLWNFSQPYTLANSSFSKWAYCCSVGVSAREAYATTRSCWDYRSSLASHWYILCECYRIFQVVVLEYFCWHKSWVYFIERALRLFTPAPRF